MRVRVQSGEQETSDGEASKKDAGRRRLDMHTAKHSVDCAAVSIQGVRWVLKDRGGGDPSIWAKTHVCLMA